MSLSVDIRPIVVQLEAALESTCAGLVALQALGPAPETMAMQDELRAGVDTLRLVISGLRAAGGEPASGLAAGFVVARAGPGPQLSPRRTA